MALVVLAVILVSGCTQNPQNTTSFTGTVTETSTRTLHPPTVTETTTAPPVTLTRTSTITVTINSPGDTIDPYEVFEPIWFELVHDDGGDMTFEWHTGIRNLTNALLKLYLRVDFLAATGSYAWDFAIVTLEPGQSKIITGSETMIAEFGNQLNDIELRIEVL